MDRTRTSESQRQGRATLVGVHVTAPGLRLRVAGPAVAAVVLGLGGHTLAGGSPPLVVVLPALLPLLVLSRFLARREMRLPSLIGLLLIGQAWVHLLASSCGHGGTVPSSSMVTAHVVAAAVVGLLLRIREARSWTAVRVSALRVLVRRQLADGATTLVVRRAVAVVVTTTADLSATAAHLARLPERRGPPLPFAA